MDGAFAPGPMAIWLQRLWEALLHYDLLAMPGAVTYVSEKSLSQAAKHSGGRMQRLRGRDKPPETGWHFTNAMQLGLQAKKLKKEADAPVMAVLFRDTDGTCSAPRQLWQIKWESMLAGFDAAGFEFGVPMLPKPKSEAWLLCSIHQGNNSQAALEDISGNDDSPLSAKARLDLALGGHQSPAQLAAWCQTNPNQWSQLMTMPSFKAFFDRFHVVANAIMRPASAGQI